MNKNELANNMRGFKRMRDEFLEPMVSFLYRHSKESFTRTEMMKALRISDHAAKGFLSSGHPYVEATLLGKDGRVLRYRSVAPMPRFTKEGKQEIQEALERFDDDLGKQAREDLEWTIQRGKPGRKRKKVIWRA